MPLRNPTSNGHFQPQWENTLNFCRSKWKLIHNLLLAAMDSEVYFLKFSHSSMNYLSCQWTENKNIWGGFHKDLCLVVSPVKRITRPNLGHTCICLSFFVTIFVKWPLMLHLALEALTVKSWLLKRELLMVALKKVVVDYRVRLLRQSQWVIGLGIESLLSWVIIVHFQSHLFYS